LGEKTVGDNAILIGRREVAQMVGCSVASVDRLVRKKAIPEPLRVMGMVRWRSSDIQSWIEYGCQKRSEPNEVAAHA
jgi:predicted DNA-binding transcriptional regulator AlpA